MKYLILIAIFCTNALARDCAPIDRDYRQYFELPNDSAILGVPVSIDDAKLLCAKDSCGTRGCECALYIRVDDCPKRVLEFQGKHKILETKTQGMPDIEIERRGDAIVPKKVQIFHWNKTKEHYEKAP